MLVFSKRNIILPAPDGSAAVRLRRGEVREIPDWAADTAYFRALAADGKIVPTGRRDKELQTAEEKKVKTRRGRETTQE